MSPMRFSTHALAVLLPLTSAVAQAPLDLQAIAERLDPGERPDILAAIPAPLRKASADAFGGIDLAGLHRAMLHGQPNSDAAALAAIAVLEQLGTDEDRDARHWCQTVACGLLLQRYQASDLFHSLVRSERQEQEIQEVARRAKAYAASLSADLLRSRQDSEVALRLLLWRGDVRPGLTNDHLHWLVTTLGERADGEDLLRLAREWLRRDQAEPARAAAAALTAWAKANPTECEASLHEIAHELRRELDLVAKMPQGQGDSPAARLARLERLQRIDPPAAEALAAELVAANAGNARPYSVLASSAFLQGKRQEALALLDRAAKLPGRDVLYATLLHFLRIGPIVAKPDLDDEVKAAVERLWAEVEAEVRSDPSPEAQFLRWLRKNLAMGTPWSAGAMTEMLPPALALRDANPEVPQFARLVLAAAITARDATAAVEALRTPLPEPLRGLPGLHLERASALLTWGAIHDAAAIREDVEVVLGEAEVAGADPREVAYRRGLLAWQLARRADGDAMQRACREAQRLFALARKQPGEPHYARNEHAHRVLQVLFDEPLDGPSWPISCLRDGGPASARTSTPILALLELSTPDTDPIPPNLVATAEREGPTSERVNHLAILAGARQRRGDAIGAAEAAKAALQAFDAAPLRIPPPGCGVVLVGEFRYFLGVRNAKADVSVQFVNDLWVAYGVPELTMLRRWADK